MDALLAREPVEDITHKGRDVAKPRDTPRSLSEQLPAKRIPKDANGSMVVHSRAKSSSPND